MSKGIDTYSVSTKGEVIRLLKNKEFSQVNVVYRDGMWWVSFPKRAVK